MELATPSVLISEWPCCSSAPDTDPALRRGVLTGLLVEHDAYAFACVTDGSRVVVVFNGALSIGGAACSARSIRDSERHAPEESAGDSPAAEARQAALEIELPHSAAIYR